MLNIRPTFSFLYILIEKFKPLLKPLHTDEDNKLRTLDSTLPEDTFTVLLFQTTLLPRRILQNVHLFSGYM